MNKKTKTLHSTPQFTVKTRYALQQGMVLCETSRGTELFAIEHGRRVWLSEPPAHILPDLLQ